MILIMTDYEVTDSSRVRVHFVSHDPAPYGHSDFYLELATTETNVNQAQLRTLLTNRLQEKYGGAVTLDDGTVKGQGIMSLNTFKNQTITVTT